MPRQAVTEATATDDFSIMGTVAAAGVRSISMNTADPAQAPHVARPAGLTAAFALYAVVLIYASLVPLDFTLRPLHSALDAFAKLVWRGTGWLSWTDVITNVLLYVPLPLLALGALAARGRRPGPGTLALVLAASTGISIAIEFAQLFIASRTPLALDIAANAAGAAAGVALWPLAAGRLARLQNLLGRFVTRDCLAPLHLGTAAVMLAVPYLLLLAWASGWLTTDWLTPAAAWRRLPALSLIPLRAHYFADIGVALASIVGVVVAYLPVGYAACAVHSRPRTGGTLLTEGLRAGAALATVFECGRLFIAGREPDFANPLFAAAGAGIGVFLACRGWRRMAQAGPYSPPDTRPRTPDRAAAAINPAWRLLAVVAFAAAVVGLWDFPILKPLLAAGAAAYVLLLSRLPYAWLIVVPAALPVFDLAPWSGRYLFDEFDILLLLTLAAGYTFAPPRRGWSTILHRGFRLTAALFAASVLISTWVALAPSIGADWSGLTAYYGPENALRVAKGSAWALALLPLLVALRDAGIDVGRLFAAGMVAGLAAATASVIWERAAFPGLTDFVRDFRAAGLMSSMHTGGAHIEAFLVLTMPFLVVGVIGAARRGVRVAYLALLPAAVYALAVTYSRGGYAGLAVALATLLLGTLLTRARGPHRRTDPLLAAGIALSLAVVVPVVGGDFAKTRLQRIAADATTRITHWREALAMRDRDVPTALFGMGLGRYPATVFYRGDPSHRPGSFAFSTGQAHGALVLGAGTPLYVEQKVPAHRNLRYDLELVARSRGDAAKVNVLLCERTYFDSFGCASAVFDPDGSATTYRGELTLHGPGRGGRPVTLSLENAAHASTVEIDRIVLRDPGGRDIIRNGDFSAGADHWFFAVTDHLPWHVKNLWVALLFDQGWFGVVAFALLLAYVITGVARSVRRHGDATGLAVLAGVLAFMTVGMVGSLFDAPRLTSLLLLALFVGQLRAGDEGSTSPATAPLRGTGADALPLERTTRHLEPPPPPRHAMRGFTLEVSAGVTLLAIAIGAIGTLPGVPYNVREVLAGDRPGVSAVLLSLCCFWLAGPPAWLGQRLGDDARLYALVLPAALLHALFGALLLSIAAPGESLHDLVGSPVLGWPPHVETLLRLAALLGTSSVLLTGGALLASMWVRQRMAAAALTAWIVGALPVLVVAHVVVVRYAASDNLTELIAGGGSVAGSLALAGGLLLLFGCASLLALTAIHRRRRGWRVLGWSIPLLAAALALLTVGLADDVNKYGRHFSALQFLLSADRAHYVTGITLVARFVAAALLVVLAVALVQYPAARLSVNARSDTPGVGSRSPDGD